MYWFDIFATLFTTISGYHLQALVTVGTRLLGQSFNIPDTNIVLYTSKVTISRFIFKFLGSLIECVLFQITIITFNKSYKDVINLLASAIKSKENEIKSALKTPIMELLKMKEIDVDSIVSDLLMPIEELSENIDLKTCVERIKNPNTKDELDLKNYHDKASKIMTDAMRGEDEEFWKILKREHLTYSNEIAALSEKYAGYILEIKKISNATRVGDNILYDFRGLFNEIVKTSRPQIWGIMIEGSTKGLWDAKKNIHQRKALGYKFIEQLSTEIPKKISGHSKGVMRKLETIESAVEIAETIVEKTEYVKTRIEGKSQVIIGHIDEQNIKTLKEAMMKEDEEIEKEISEESRGKGFDARIRKIIQKAETISERILGIELISQVMEKYEGSYSLLVSALEYTLKMRARDITNSLKNTDKPSKITSLIIESMKTKPDELVKTLVKNRITDIIIDRSTQIAEKPTQIEIINQIKATIKKDIHEKKNKSKLEKTLSEINRRLSLLKKTDKIAECIVEQNNLSKLVGIAASILGREIKEHKESIRKIVKDGIDNIITDNVSIIAENEDEETIKETISSLIIGKITGKLTVKSDAITHIKVDHATIECRKIFSIATLTAMFIMRSIMLWNVHTSTNVGYHGYIIVVIESLLLGMFQNSLLTLAANNSETIRLSIESSNVLVLALQGILVKLFYKNNRCALTIHMWVMFALNILAIIMWPCSIFGDLLGIKTKADKIQKNNNESSLWSPYLMFFFASLLKEFLFPKTLPSALINVEKPLARDIIMSLFSIGGTVLAITIQPPIDRDRTISGITDIFWAFLGPMIVVCAMTLSAIHKNGGISKHIRDNNPFVLFLCFVLLLCHSAMTTVSYVAVAHYVEKRKEKLKGYIESHGIVCDFFAFLISRLSGGYDRVRRDYGLGSNVLIPDAVEPRSLTEFVRECLSAAWKDTACDFKKNITDCL